MNYIELCKTESAGTYGQFGIKIEVAGHLPETLDDDRIYAACREAQDKVTNVLRAIALESDPKAQEARKKEREQLIGLFQEPVFVEEIPNGYCSQWCCKHLPWFRVTTKVGVIVIGWRKRVISIDWSATFPYGTKTADELFPDEDVTKDTRGIHAWSIEKAKQYIDAILLLNRGRS
ncbi:MAG TPA: hypothetical protein VNZ86_12255 [Bacteroidia bacterium]|jgi:hypothetical protein|nr:hypothetical protein [Bacteroidia bacterium]